MIASTLDEGVRTVAKNAKSREGPTGRGEHRTFDPEVSGIPELQGTTQAGQYIPYFRFCIGAVSKSLKELPKLPSEPEAQRTSWFRRPNPFHNHVDDRFVPHSTWTRAISLGWLEYRVATDLVYDHHPQSVTNRLLCRSVVCAHPKNF